MLFNLKTLLTIFLGLFFSQALDSGNVQESFIRIDDAPAHYYHPEIVYETYGEGIELPTGLEKGSMEETAISFAMHKLGVDRDEVLVRAGFASDITEHVYLSQVHNGIPFVNAVANVAKKNGRIVSFGSSFVKMEKVAPSQPSVDKKDAIAAAEAALDCTYNLYPTSLQYLANPDGSSSLVHVIRVNNKETGKYYQAHVDAHTGKLISMVNFVAEVKYYAVPVTMNSILDGQSLLVDPEDLKASELGWHADSDRTYNITQGNNGLALSVNLTDVHYTAESSRVTYNYSYDTSQEPDVGSNLDAAIVNAFYILNMAHDVTYRYGFTEKAFNFQMSNFNRGGQENDGIIMSVNDITNENNAGFATAPDGESGVCSLYLFKHTKPFRPVAMDNSVVLHEFGHGLSSRLIGGGSATCLSELESRGLGEGWSDAFADWMAQTSTYTRDFMIGTYVLPPPYATYGFRKYPYSTDREVNPRKYSDLRDMKDEHEIGEVWANMLHNVYAKLTAEHGYSTTAMFNPDGTAGNVVFMHLLIDSFSLLPCQPDFLAARDFFIQADANRYKSVHRCLLWTVFASRGLGFNARQYVDDYELPTEC